MSWIRNGDTAGTHPALLAVREHPAYDSRLINEIRGFVQGCAEMASTHDQDYVVTRGTAITAAGDDRAEVMIEVALFAGLFTDTIDLGRGRVGYLLMDDPAFLHLRTKAEKEWEAQRKRDISNPAMTAPVRLRDGDACRFCANVVIWGDNRSARGATYDHAVPGQPGELRVACRACNAGRRDYPDADERYPPLPVPETPYYSPGTIAWLAKKGYDPRTDTQSENATRPAAADPARPAPPPDGPAARPPRGTAPARSDTPSGTAPTPTDQSRPVLTEPSTAEPGFAGSGTGRVGSGASPPQGSRPPRRRRGRRGRAPSPPANHPPPTGDRPR